jgi:hypothetical protein
MMVIGDPNLKIVEVVCIVEDPAKPSYCIGGVIQRSGDHCHIPLLDANPLVSRGKARIIDESNRVEAP